MALSIDYREITQTDIVFYTVSVFLLHITLLESFIYYTIVNKVAIA